MSTRRPWLPWFALFILYVVWGSTYLAIRYVVAEMPPRAPAALRFLVAGSVMLAFGAYRDRVLPTARQIAQYAVVGVLLLGVSNGLVMWSEQYVPSGIAALVVATVPLWTMLLDALRPGGEPWSGRVLFGTGLGLAGVALVARPEGALDGARLWGIGALLFASVSWTSGAVYSVTIRPKLPVFTVAAIEMLAGGLFLLVTSWLVGEDWGRLASASRHAWGGLVYLGVFGSLVGFTAFAYCLSHLSPTATSTYAYVNPVVAVVLGKVFLGEALSRGLVTGGALILAAVVLTTIRARPSALAEPEEPAA